MRLVAVIVAAALLNCLRLVVCDDPQLTGLDHRLQTAYQQALAPPSADQTALTAAQNSWATAREWLRTKR